MDETRVDRPKRTTGERKFLRVERWVKLVVWTIASLIVFLPPIIISFGQYRNATTLENQGKTIAVERKTVDTQTAAMQEYMKSNRKAIDGHQRAIDGLRVDLMKISTLLLELSTRLGRDRERRAAREALDESSKSAVKPRPAPAPPPIKRTPDIRQMLLKGGK